MVTESNPAIIWGGPWFMDANVFFPIVKWMTLYWSFCPRRIWVPKLPTKRMVFYPTAKTKWFYITNVISEKSYKHGIYTTIFHSVGNVISCMMYQLDELSICSLICRIILPEIDQEWQPTDAVCGQDAWLARCVTRQRCSASLVAEFCLRSRISAAFLNISSRLHISRPRGGWQASTSPVLAQPRASLPTTRPPAILKWLPVLECLRAIRLGQLEIRLHRHASVCAHPTHPVTRPHAYRQAL